MSTNATILQSKPMASGREAEIFEYSEGRVLRLIRHAATAAAVEREVAAMRAVRSVVPFVPEVFETVVIDGRPGIVMERVAGSDLLSVMASRPWMVGRIGATMGQLHARLHDVVAPLEVESLVKRTRHLATREDRVPRRILDWALPQFEEMPDGDRLLHGDFHPGNILSSADGPFVIDWASVTRGNPDADLARSVLTLQVGTVPPDSPLIVRYGARFVRRLLVRSYVRAYRRYRAVDTVTLERWITLRAVDRLADGIAEERTVLLANLERAMAG